MMGTLRVVMLIQKYHPLIGGAERQIRSIAPALRSRGIDVIVVTKRFRGLPSFEVVDGVPVHRMPVAWPPQISSPSFVAASLPLIRRLRPDVIHAYSLFSPMIAALLAQQMLGVPAVVKVLRGGSLGDVARLRRKPLGRRRLAHATSRIDAFVSISREIAAELAELGVPPDRRPLIPNGVDTARFAPPRPDERRTLRARLGLGDGLVTVYSGRLMPEKRVEHLVHAWPAVRSTHPDAELLIVGGGPLNRSLRAAASPGVRFAGPVDDVAPYLQAADLFVLPSVSEGLSNSLLEAMSTGLPCIATEVGGASDVVAHGVNGWLVPADAIEPLREAIVCLLGDPLRRTHVGRNGRQRIVQDYSLTSVAEELRTLYSEVVLSRRPDHVLVPSREAPTVGASDDVALAPHAGSALPEMAAGALAAQPEDTSNPASP